MRIVAEKRVRQYMKSHPDARAALEEWIFTVRRTSWKSLNDARQTYPTADGVTVASGRTATVFNIRGNNYRLVTAVHFNTQTLFVLRFLTHAEYDKMNWREQL